jgi:hypothetical protein
MAEDGAGTDQRGDRRPYVKPFVRNLDASDTEGSKVISINEYTFTAMGNPTHGNGPS